MFSGLLELAKHKLMWPIYAIAATAILFAATTPGLSAAREVIPYDDLDFFIELNDTDGDAGVQLMLDGEQWRRLMIFSPDRKKLLDVKATRTLKTQGLTEFFFESAEPSFEDVSLEEFLERFPEGEYKFFGTTIEGDRLAGTAEFTHDLPGAPVIVSPQEGETVESDDVEIEWEPVTTPEGIEIVSYEVIVESDEADGEFRVLLPGDATEVEVPEEIFDPEVTEYKFEILAKEESGNQTITASEFVVKFVDDDDEDEDEDEDEGDGGE